MQLPVLKRTGTSRAPSTAVEVLEELALAHELPRMILEWRSLMKLKGTYIDALPQLVNPETGRVHTCFNQAVAATGRLEQQRSEPAEHPDQDRARARDPPRLHRRSRPRARLRRLLADRVPRARAPLRGSGRSSRRSREGADFHERTALKIFGADSGLRSAPAAQHREDGQLRAALRQVGVHAVEGHRRHAPRRRRNSSTPTSPAFRNVRAFIDRTLEEGRAHRRRQDDVRPPPAGARS